MLSTVDVLEASEIQARIEEESIEESLVQLKTAQPICKTLSKTCLSCGFSWPHRNSPCLAQSQCCRKFGCIGHFAKVCKSPRKKSFTVKNPHPKINRTVKILKRPI